MSVETRGRAAAEGLRVATPVDVEAGLSRLRRTRRRRGVGRVVVTLFVLAVVAAGLSWLQRSQRIDPVDPDEVHNGEIIGGATYWLEGPTPTMTGSAYTVWDAFDQDSESFLYLSGSRRVVVMKAEGLVADFLCPRSADCHENLRLHHADTFGPGPDELTMPTRVGKAEAVTSAQVVAYDGTVRQTVDLSPTLEPGHTVVDLAWSPDGTRLAVGTTSCAFLGDEACEVYVWVLERDGGTPQLVHTETRRNNDDPILVDMAWSPDGQDLGLVAASRLLRHPPRLVVLRLEPGKPVRGDTLRVLECDDNCQHGTVPSNFYVAFSFAWSPDGTRVAVNDPGVIIEVAVDDGEVLAVRAGLEAHGPLAWLREH